MAKADITDHAAGPVNDLLFAKALVFKSGEKLAALITIDAVAIGGIGRINDKFLPRLRERLQKELKISPENVLVNASHCHGVVRADLDDLVVKAVTEAHRNLEAVKAGAGTGREDRIQENRRLILKDGRQADVRHAYSMPEDKAVASFGPIDPQIGLLRIDRLDGTPLAAVYNFACHPIQGVPSRGNTADFPAFASKVIEENLGEGVMAFFLQGCAGDINPVAYKEVRFPRDAESLGNLLGLSALKGLKTIQTKADAPLRLKNKVLAIPRATDMEQRIEAIEAEQKKLVGSLRGTTLDLKTFVPLLVQYKLAEDFPSYYSHRYLKEKADGKEFLSKLDVENRASLEAYLRNVRTMEQLTRLNANLDLLKKNLALNRLAGKPHIDAELCLLQIGGFTLLTFPGELTVQIGLNLKKASPVQQAFIAGYTNGYYFYLPTAEQRNNSGYAQEDCDCLVAPQWQKIFETAALEMLRDLQKEAIP
ncbi:MAG: hypothetical protein EXR99_12775 [Gemmataceae bacterium]|nr:hypothetical protein [Gemmataceae bacterium]